MVKNCSLVGGEEDLNFFYLENSSKLQEPFNNAIESEASTSSNCPIRRSMARIQRKGTSGQAKNFVTRTQAVRKLQVSLPDFRRLCIFKGKLYRMRTSTIWLIWSRNISSRASKQEEGFQGSNFIYNLLLHKGCSISTS